MMEVEGKPDETNPSQGMQSGSGTQRESRSRRFQRPQPGHAGWSSQSRNHVEFDEVVADAGAGTELEPVADFVSKGVEGVGGTQAVAAALRVFAACDVAAIVARFY